MNPRAGFILMFTGDKRKPNLTVDNATSFSAQSGVLAQGTTDVTATYCSGSVTALGNILVSHQIGSTALPAGNYRYYLSGTYGGKKRTWYWDILVLFKDLSVLYEFPLEDYDPFIDEIVLYDNDTASKAFTPGIGGITAATGVFKLLDSDVTSTYCTSSVTVNAAGDSVTTHLIGGAAAIPPADYAYFLTLTYDSGETVATFYYKVKALGKQSIQ